MSTNTLDQSSPSLHGMIQHCFCTNYTLAQITLRVASCNTCTTHSCLSQAIYIHSRKQPSRAAGHCRCAHSKPQPEENNRRDVLACTVLPQAPQQADAGLQQCVCERTARPSKAAPADGHGWEPHTPTQVQWRPPPAGPKNMLL